MTATFWEDGTLWKRHNICYSKRHNVADLATVAQLKEFFVAPGEFPPEECVCAPIQTNLNRKRILQRVSGKKKSGTKVEI